jgi:hypothetical protein
MFIQGARAALAMLAWTPRDRVQVGRTLGHPDRVGRNLSLSNLVAFWATQPYSNSPRLSRSLGEVITIMASLIIKIQEIEDTYFRFVAGIGLEA